MTKQFFTCVLSLELLLALVISAAQPRETASAPLIPPPETTGILGAGVEEVSNTGSPISSWFPISPIDSSELNEGNSAVAYNSQWQEYLVVWFKNETSGESYILGQFVNNHGTLIGNRFLIPGWVGSCGFPDVAYNPARNEYLVVFSYSTPSAYAISGLLLNAYGTAIGTQLTFASHATNQYREPAVVYATNSSEYLVVWQKNQGTENKGIEARTLSGDGATMGSILQVTGMLASVAPSVPDVACTPTLEGCLVVWQQWYDASYPDHDIKGQRIHMSGGAHLEDSTFGIHLTTNDEVAPAIAAITRITGIGQYLVVCAYKWSGTWTTVGQFLTDAGALDLWLPIGTSNGGFPAVAGNETAQEYLVAWTIEISSGPDLRMRTVSSVGDLGTTSQASPPRSGSSPLAPAIANGYLGDYLVTCHDYYQSGYPVDILGFLWGRRVFLPLLVQ